MKWGSFFFWCLLFISCNRQDQDDVNQVGSNSKNTVASAGGESGKDLFKARCSFCHTEKIFKDKYKISKDSLSFVKDFRKTGAHHKLEAISDSSLIKIKEYLSDKGE